MPNLVGGFLTVLGHVWHFEPEAVQNEDLAFSLHNQKYIKSGGVRGHQLSESRLLTWTIYYLPPPPMAIPANKNRVTNNTSCNHGCSIYQNYNNNKKVKKTINLWHYKGLVALSATTLLNFGYVVAPEDSP